MKLDTKVALASLIIIPFLWCIADHFGLLRTIKNEAMNWRFLVRGELELPKDAYGKTVQVVHVDFDAETVPIVGERPWDRNFFADIGTILLHKDYGNAACIGFDFIFSSQSMSRMVPPENVLRSDQAIGNLVMQYPEKTILAGFYSSIHDPLYMKQRSAPPYRVPFSENQKAYTTPSENPYPETPAYPVVNYIDGTHLGRIGMIDFDSLRSFGPIPRVVPAYYEYAGDARSLNILTSRLKAFAVERGINSKLIHSDHPSYLMHLVEVSGNSENIIAHIFKEDKQLKLVDIDHKLLPIEPNTLPASEEINFYHMSIQLVLAYHGLDEDRVVIDENRKELLIKDQQDKILYKAPLLDEQNIKINWFSSWTPPDLSQNQLPPMIGSKINPRCSIKDVLAYYNELIQAENTLLSLGLNLKETYEVQKKKIDTERLESSSALNSIEKALVANPAIKEVVKDQLLLAKQRKQLADEKSNLFLEASEKRKLAREFFSHFDNAIILVGPVDKIFQDLAPTPFEKNPEPKVAVHSNMVKTVFSGLHLKAVSPWIEYCLAYLFSLISIGIYSYRGNGETGLKAFGLILFLLYVILVFYLFSSFHLILPLIVPMGAYLTTSLITFSETAFLEQKQKGRIKKMFGSYVAPELVEQMVENENEPSLGGVDTEITALFSDIQSFSTFSELLTSPQLVDLMNEYLSEMTDILHEERGTLDKYIGDAIVAMYGAPVHYKSHAYQAVKTAIRMQEMQAVLREKWQKEGEKWPQVVSMMQTRIGMNSGIATVGNMGAKDRFNYTMMGDVVNLAARCESGSKSLGAYVMITEDTYRLAKATKDDVLYRFLDKIVVKGRTEPVGMYEVIGHTHDIDQNTRDCLEIYDEAYQAYQNQKFQKAYELFEISSRKEPKNANNTPGFQTNPSRIFMDRCKTMKTQPKIENWDGVYVMTTK